MVGEVEVGRLAKARGNEIAGVNQQTSVSVVVAPPTSPLVWTMTLRPNKGAFSTAALARATTQALEGKHVRHWVFAIGVHRGNGDLLHRGYLQISVAFLLRSDIVGASRSV
jgi:hypothetical protein